MKVEKALLLANLCNISYYDKDNVKNYLTNNYDSFCWFSSENIEGFGCRNLATNSVYIVIRGTQNNWKDILSDLKTWRVKSGDGYVHYGFNKSSSLILDQVENYLNNFKNNKIIYTGHSLGAAVATVLASFLPANELYTFGSPRVGNDSFVNMLNQKDVKHYRIVNNKDAITGVPFSFMGFQHHGELIYLNYYGDTKELTTIQSVKDTWRSRLRAIKKLECYSGLYDHKIEEYIKKVAHVYSKSKL